MKQTETRIKEMSTIKWYFKELPLQLSALSHMISFKRSFHHSIQSLGYFAFPETLKEAKRLEKPYILFSVFFFAFYRSKCNIPAGDKE